MKQFKALKILSVLAVVIMFVSTLKAEEPGIDIEVVPSRPTLTNPPKPTNTEELKPTNTEELKPTNTEELKPTNTEELNSPDDNSNDNQSIPSIPGNPSHHEDN
jgi:hypothetical protein